MNDILSVCRLQSPEAESESRRGSSMVSKLMSVMGRKRDDDEHRVRNKHGKKKVSLVDGKWPPTRKWCRKLDNFWPFITKNLLVKSWVKYD